MPLNKRSEAGHVHLLQAAELGVADTQPGLSRVDHVVNYIGLPQFQADLYFSDRRQLGQN